MNFLQGEMHVMNSSPPVQFALNDVGMIGIEGWIVQSDNQLTDFANIDTLWDTGVPKDDGQETVDESWAEDTDSVYEPGVMNVNQIFDLELGHPERIWQREFVITRASSFGGWVPSIDGETQPSAWHAAFVVPIKVRKKYRAMSDSGILFGYGSPTLDETPDLSVYPQGGLINQSESRFIVKYLAQFLDKAVFDFLGLTETGAESPWDDTLAMILSLITQLHSNQGFLGTVHYQVSGKATCGIEVPGYMHQTTIGPDMQSG